MEHGLKLETGCKCAAVKSVSAAFISSVTRTDLNLRHLCLLIRNRKQFGSRVKNWRSGVEIIAFIHYSLFKK